MRIIMGLVVASALAVCFMDPASAATEIRIDRLDRLNLGPVKVVPRPGLAAAAAVRKFRRSTAILRGSSSSRPLEPSRPVTRATAFDGWDHLGGEPLLGCGRSPVSSGIRSRCSFRSWRATWSARAAINSLRSASASATGLTVDRHHAFLNREAAGLDAEPRRGEQQKRLARLRCGGAHLRATAMDR